MSAEGLRVWEGMSIEPGDVWAATFTERVERCFLFFEDQARPGFLRAIDLDRGTLALGSYTHMHPPWRVINR